MTQPPKEEREDIDTIVRDSTSINYGMTKSELRRRINGLLSSSRTALIEEVGEGLRNLPVADVGLYDKYDGQPQDLIWRPSVQDLLRNKLT